MKLKSKEQSAAFAIVLEEFENPEGKGLKPWIVQGLKPCGERVFVQFRVLNPKGFALPAKPLGFFRCV